MVHTPAKQPEIKTRQQTGDSSSVACYRHTSRDDAWRRLLRLTFRGLRGCSLASARFSPEDESGSDSKWAVSRVELKLSACLSASRALVRVVLQTGSETCVYLCACVHAHVSVCLFSSEFRVIATSATSSRECCKDNGPLWLLMGSGEQE